MRYLRVLPLLAVAVTTSGCFQFSSLLVVKPDGSGTIEQRMMFTQAAVAQLRQLAALGGGTQDFDPFSEEQARDAAAALGPGVTYVSSAPLDTVDGMGREIRYAFTDINSLRLDQGPPGPAGVSVQSGSDDRVSFKLTRQPSGNALLTISVPQMPVGPGGSGSPLPGPASAEQLALLKPMLAGARVQIDIEPAGQLVRTSSPFVTGKRVTLLDVNIDALLSDETLLRRLQAAGTPEDTKTILKSVPGLKLNLDPELTIEFQ
ncbi:MAG TPA: hypothetical protein VM818_11455 [Vicinamibacterales bacterium]|nr:hypothetical protein [Vicinamibacterales bacterium]